MKESSYKSCDELPLFLDFKIGTPARPFLPAVRAVSGSVGQGCKR